MRQLIELSYSVRLPVLCKYFGQYCFVLAVLTVPPVIVAAMVGAWWPASCYGLVAIGTALLGALLSRFHSASNVQGNEAMILVVVSFVYTSLVMTFPFMSEGLPFWDAWFESVSAVTTTGLTSLTNLDERSRSLLFARAWMQWYGGLGIVVFSVALLVHPGITARRLILAEEEPETLVGNTRVHARRTLYVYAMLTAIAFVVLLIGCRDWFDAVAYALAAVSTGGFAPHDDSLAALHGGWTAQLLTILICFAGAVPLVLYESAFHGNWRESLRSPQLRALVMFGLVLVLVVFSSLWAIEGMSAVQAARHAPLLSLTAQSTAGFSSLDVQTLEGPTKLALILAMFIGGGLGSSAGGIKIWRVLVFLRLLRLVIVRTGSPPHAVIEPRLGEHRLMNEEIMEAGLIAGLFFSLIFASWTTFVIFGYDSIDGLFEVVSATGTVGLSTGITSTELPVLLKCVLCFDMLLGRVEVFAFLVVFYPRTWFGSRAEQQ